MDNCKNKTPLPGAEEKRSELRDDEGEAIVTIPLVVRPVIVRVQPLTIIVAVHVKQVRIAVGNVNGII